MMTLIGIFCFFIEGAGKLVLFYFIEEVLFVQKLYKKYELKFIQKVRCKRAYQLIQIAMAYYFEKCNGSNIWLSDVFYLYSDGELLLNEDHSFFAKEVQEIRNFFLTFDHMMWTLEESLSKDVIKDLHSRMRLNVYEDIVNGSPGGEFEDKHKDEISKQLDELLAQYKPSQKHTLKEIINFHMEFMKICPFSIGSDEIGKLIMFRECINSELHPVLIRDSSKYKSALEESIQTQDVEPLFKFIESEQTKHGSSMFRRFFEEYLSVYNEVREIEYEDAVCEARLEGQKILIKNLIKVATMLKEGYSEQEIKNNIDGLEECMALKLYEYVEKDLRKRENENEKGE